MSELVIRKYLPTLSSPIYIVALSGPNELGKIVTHLLIDRTNSKLFTEFYNEHFPDHIKIMEDGTCRLLRYELYESSLASPNLLIACGDDEISFENVVTSYEVLHDLVMLGIDYETSSLIVIDTVPMINHDSIYAVATDKKNARLLEQEGVRLIRDARLPGPAGTILGICRLQRLNAIGIFSSITESGKIEASAKTCLKIIEKHFGLRYPEKI